MISPSDPHQPLRLWSTFEDTFHHVTRPVLIVIATDKQLRHSALWQKAIAVISTLGAHRNSEADQPLHTRVAAAGAQPDTRAEGEACEEHRATQIVLHPIQSSLHVLLFSYAFVM